MEKQTPEIITLRKGVRNAWYMFYAHLLQQNYTYSLLTIRSGLSSTLVEGW